jgi:hypothetical protein
MNEQAFNNQQEEQAKEEDKHFTRYKQAWGMTQRLNEENPDQLQMKLTLYGELYELTGKFYAAAKADAELKKIDRIEQEARVYLGFPNKKAGGKYTEKERDAKATLATILLLKQETKFRNEAFRWENARDSLLEQINIMKRKQDIMTNLFQRGNTLNGGR